MAIWMDLLEALGSVLRFFHDITVGAFGGYAWTVAIVLLTVAVRLLLMPLAVRQFRSMQAMQQLRPQMKKIQQRYKTDRGMMRTDPEKYRERRQKQQEETMALYKEHNVNPASSCLPLIAQMPIFVALFSVLRSPDVIPELVSAPFPIGTTLQAQANQAGIIAIVLLVLMGVTTFVQQKQMMGRNAAMADDQQMQQQKLMLYIMPVFLAVLGFNLPVGVLVYWVTTNLWQMGQQWFMLREVEHTPPPPKGPKSDPRPKKDPSKDPKPGGGKKLTGTPPSAGGAKGKKAGSPPSAGGAKGKKAGSPPSAGGAKGKKAGSPPSAGGAKGKKAGSPPSAGGAKGKKAGDEAGRANGAGKKNTNRNGHQPGGPSKISKNRDETGDKRR